MNAKAKRGKKPRGNKKHWEGGVLAVPRQLIRSEAYLDLSLSARCLILVLQDVWDPSLKSVHYSVRRAASALGVSKSTAARSLAELEAHGFIKMESESSWLNGEAREWQLTWKDNNGKLATNEWMAWQKKLDPTSQERDGKS